MAKREIRMRVPRTEVVAFVESLGFDPCVVARVEIDPFVMTVTEHRNDATGRCIVLESGEPLRLRTEIKVATDD